MKELINFFLNAPIEEVKNKLKKYNIKFTKGGEIICLH